MRDHEDGKGGARPVRDAALPVYIDNFPEAKAAPASAASQKTGGRDFETPQSLPWDAGNSPPQGACTDTGTH
jgi:hypothetical protein